MALLTFLGATQQVTGSCYLIETRDGAKVLLECGMRQGRREDEAQNRAPFTFDPASLDAVVISHAHIDHTGLLPRLVASGYRGPIFATEATCDLMELMLLDAANIGENEQFDPKFLAISPNNKIPAIIDPDGPDGPGGQPLPLFESGAILLYLAGKTGFGLPADTRGKYEVLQWLMFQMGGVGPMLGQAHHFRIYAPEKIDYAIERYSNEARRLYGVINKRLAASTYLGGKDYSIADIAVFPWLRSWKNQGVAMNDYPHLKGWFDEIAKRPAVLRGLAAFEDKPRAPLTDAAREVMFGARQLAQR